MPDDEFLDSFSELFGGSEFSFDAGGLGSMTLRAAIAGAVQQQATVDNGPPEPAANHTTYWATDLAVGDGNPVGTWAPRTDLLALGNLTEATNRPLLDVDAAGGRPAVVFDATNDVLTSSSITAIGPAQVVVVGKYGSVNSRSNFGSGTSGNRLNLGVNGGNWQVYAGGTGQSGGTYDNTTLHLFVVTANNAGNEILEVDGTQVINANAGNNTPARVMLNTDGNGVFGGFTIAFVQVVDDGGMTSGELAALESWVSSYYGISIS